MSIEDLDNFTLINIFSYLTVEDIVLSVRPTCKRWQDISQEPHLWKTGWDKGDIYRSSCGSVDTSLLRLLKVAAPCFENLIYDYDIALHIEEYINQNSSIRGFENLDNIENRTIENLLSKYPNINRFSFCINKWVNKTREDNDRHLSSLKIPNIKYLSLDQILRRGIGRTPPETSGMMIKDFVRNHPTLEGIRMDIDLYESTLDLLLDTPNLRAIEISTTIPRIASDFNVHPTLSLQEIRLHGSAIQDSHLQTLCCNVIHLRDLGIFYCENITDTAFRTISQCHELDTLTIGHCESLTEHVYSNQISKCSWIKKIRINTSGRSDMFSQLDWFDQSYPITFHNHCFTTYEATVMADVGLQSLASGCNSIRELHLLGCKRVTDSGVMAVADHCPKLDKLDLSGCQNVTDVSLLALAEQSHGLHTLLLNECFHVTEVGVGPLITKCRNLKKLGLAFAGYLQNLHLNQFLSLPSKFGEFVPCHNADSIGDHVVLVGNDGLQDDKMAPCFCRYEEDPYVLFFDGVLDEHETERCSKLAKITDPKNFREMYRCLNGKQHSQKNNTSVAERKVIRHKIEMQGDKITHIKERDQIGGHPALQEDLKSSKGVSIDGNISSARERFLSCLSDPSLPNTRQHSNITHLNLRCCVSLDDQSLDQITFHCPDLRILDIEKCSRITDASLHSIARNSHVLKTLRMTSLPLCTKEGVLQLAHSLDLLEEIQLSIDSKSCITAADIKDLNGRKTAKGKYISISHLELLGISEYDHEDVDLNLVSDAAYNRILLKEKYHAIKHGIKI